jgi:hypothetical protein
MYAHSPLQQSFVVEVARATSLLRISRARSATSPSEAKPVVRIVSISSHAPT